MSRKTLCTLRLVNKAFFRSASPRLLRHVDARANRGNPRLLEGLQQLRNSPWAVYVRQLDIGFDFFARESSYAYAENLSRILPPSLARLPNLAALELHGVNISLPEEVVDGFMDTVATTLRIVPLPNLAELEVKFPVPSDFGRFFPSQSRPLQIPIAHILGRLRHLGLYLTEYRFLQSPRFPNEDDAVNLIRMVELAPGLRSLAIDGRNRFDIGYIGFADSLRLESLFLEEVSVSPSFFLSLVDRCQDSMRYMELARVRLKSGTWPQVLLPISDKLLRLLSFRIRGCGYSPDGTSSHLATKPFRPILGPEPKHIETRESRDLHALGDLQRQVNATRAAAGEPAFGDDVFQCIPLPSVECSLGSCT